VAAIKLKIVVDHLDNVMLEFDQIKVYRSTTGKEGVYAEITVPGTRVDLVAGTTLYEYIDSAGDPDYWYKFAFFNSSTSNEGTASEPLQGTGRVGVYCTIQDIRDEGIASTVFSDARVNAAIEVASRFIETATGRWFEARSRTFRVKARNTRVCFLNHPIISLSEVNIVTGRGSAMTRDAIDVSDVLVFNRHLTEGLTDPDDRDAPRIEFEGVTGYEYPGRIDGVFLVGSQTIEVVGRFGYTELAAGETPGETSDGSQVPTSEGVTPPLIEHLCKLLTVRELSTLANPDDRASWRDLWRLESEKTADQSYKMTSLDRLGMQGYVTGDPEIDGIINLFRAPASIGVV